MDKSIKIVTISIIIVFALVALIILFPSTSNLNPGDSIDIRGEIAGINYINTSYGDLPIITLKDHSDKFRNAGLLDNKIYSIEGWTEALNIYGDFNKEYNIGDSIDITLHFDEMQLHGAKFLWAKELGFYLELPSAITQALDYTANIAGFYLKWISSDNEGHTSYEIFTTNKDQYSLNLFNVSLKKISADTDLQENAVFSTLLNTTIDFFSKEYLFVSGMGAGIEKIDFMSSLNDGISQNGFIEFIDKNSNNLIDDHDVINLSIPPTEDDTKLETYLLLIGIDDNGDFNKFASGCKYLINWYDGIYEQIIEKELIAINYTLHQEHGTLIDTTLEVSRANSKTDLSIDNFQIFIDYNNSYLSGDLKDGNIIKEEHINVDFIDLNKNELLDVGDLFLISGLENNTSAILRITNNQGNTIAYYPWIIGEGYSRDL